MCFSFFICLYSWSHSLMSSIVLETLWKLSSNFASVPLSYFFQRPSHSMLCVFHPFFLYFISFFFVYPCIIWLFSSGPSPDLIISSAVTNLLSLSTEFLTWVTVFYKSFFWNFGLVYFQIFYVTIPDSSSYSYFHYSTFAPLITFSFPTLL